MKRNWLLVILYSALIIASTVYTFTQVDLNLTLSSNAIYQSAQHLLLQLGYYNRPLSAGLFVLSVLLLFFSYGYCLWQIKQQKLPTRILWIMIGLTGIFVFAYAAFSHDIFNYMFDARIVTRYGLSPYVFKALDFPADPWIRFMRWTHRYYPYGSLWLTLTILPSWIGGGKFILTLVLFKLLFFGLHLLNCLLIGKIVKLSGDGKSDLAVALYGLNPLVLIESVVSPHNEVMMLTFVLLSFYILLKKRYFSGFLSLGFSVAIKFVSAVLLPLLILGRPQQKHFYVWVFILWSLILLPLVILREPYAWYFVPLVGIAAISGNRVLYILSSGLSFGGILRYAPYLYLGEYSTMTFKLQTWIAISTLILTLIGLLWLTFRRRSDQFRVS